MEEKKERFIENLKAAGGIISIACEATGISRPTYYNWYKNDAEFSTRADEIKEMQIDFVESKLMGLIKNGDTTATIFYLKTKGKKRGWTEKVQLQPVQPQTAPPEEPAHSLPGPVISDEERKEAKKAAVKRIKNKKTYIVKMLKQQGKYTAELSMQVGIVAQLLVRADILAEEIFDSSHQPINIEISREGNERESINPKEKLYLDYLGQGQKALRALGMNTDSRERKSSNDDLNKFMDAFNDDTE